MAAERLVSTAALWPFREHDGDINLEDDPAYLDNLVELVRAFGITEPLVLNVTDDAFGDDRLASVWDGNHRLVAAYRLGIDQVPLVVRYNLATTFPGYPYHGEFD
jgi:ParB-like chromosome segregation protein Spo0J